MIDKNSYTDKDDNFDTTDKQENEQILESVESDATDTYYNDTLSKQAVGRLFNDYVKIQEEETPVKETQPYQEDSSIAEILKRIERSALGSVLKESSKDGGHTYDDDYIEYINSMADGSEKDDSKRYLEQPEAIKQLTQRQKVIKMNDEVQPVSFDSGYEDNLDIVYSEKPDTNSPKEFFFSYKFFLGASCIIVLLMFAFFILKINSLNDELATSKEKLATANKLNMRYDELAKSNEQLQQRISELTTENESIKQQYALNSNPPEDVVTAPEDMTPMGTPDSDLVAPEPQPEVNTPQQSDVIKDTPTPGYKYKLKSGDNLSKIAQKAYGSSSKYKDIMEANNISNDKSLQIGTELIIPQL